MASSSPSPLSRGWYCIIETLAESTQVELPLLKELVGRVPDFYTAAPEPVRERLALRYLEECASRGIVATKDKSGGTIDVTRSSEEVLCGNLTKSIDLSDPVQSRTVPISDEIRQFISQKRSTLPKPSLDLLKESAVEGNNPKSLSRKEKGRSSSHRQEDNIAGEEREVATSPRSPDHAESLQKDPSQALDADKTDRGSPLGNNPTTAVAHGSNLEAARTEPSGDDVNQFIFMRRPAVPKTSSQGLKEHILEKNPIRRNQNTSANFNGGPNTVPDRSRNTNLSDDRLDSESNPMCCQMPCSEPNLCIRCNKGGNLLTCSRKDCKITVHESCITTTAISFDKEGQFYCPCCACTRAAQAYARAKKVFSLAKESLSSFLDMEKRQNQQKGDGDSSEDGGSEADLAGFSGDRSRSSESALRAGRRRAELNGERKDKEVKSNEGNVLEHRNMLGRRGKGARGYEADLASERLEKFKNTKSGPGGTSGSHEAALSDEERENERRTEGRGDANVNRKRQRPTPRYSNKVVAPGRRKFLPWTTEEEEALREGMQKFGVTADGKIPWREILIYRRHVFHKTRLPIDLKDKWRNMMKKEGSFPA